MAECLGLCEYEDDICLGCGRDFSQIEPAPQNPENQPAENDKAAPLAGNAASPDVVSS